ELGTAGPAAEVLLRLRATQLAHGPRDANLMARDGPVEDERGAAVPRQVSALATSVVGIEEEGAVLDALEKHHPRRPTLFARCGARSLPATSARRTSWP